MNSIPQWALKYKTKGVHIRNFSDHYYAYRSRSVYDKKTKKTKTLPGKYLGVDTPHIHRCVFPLYSAYHRLLASMDGIRWVTRHKPQ